jgi:hypothetical protein
MSVVVFEGADEITSKRSVLGPKRLIYFFMNNIFNLKGSCVLRTLKNSFAIF